MAREAWQFPIMNEVRACTEKSVVETLTPITVVLSESSREMSFQDDATCLFVAFDYMEVKS